MNIIHTIGKKNPIQSWPNEVPVPENHAIVPDTFDMAAYLRYAGYGTLSVEHGVVTGFTPDEAAYSAWKDATAPTLDELRPAKLKELSAACSAAIVAGCEVELSDSTTGHFSLEETDQINIATAQQAVMQGAAGFPYHADGQLCRLYPAADIIALSNAAAGHKLYHTTYHNHLKVWALHTETKAELEGIFYGAELPPDLAANMEGILHGATG